MQKRVKYYQKRLKNGLKGRYIQVKKEKTEMRISEFVKILLLCTKIEII